MSRIVLMNFLQKEKVNLKFQEEKSTKWGQIYYAIRHVPDIVEEVGVK